MPTPLPATGTRRRRLWELDSHAHCPVLGVCLPLAALRRLVDKVVGGQAVADDYTLHSGAVAESRQRNRLSEALQKQLDQRYALTVRRAARLRSTADLTAWWTEAAAGHDLPGALWATLTHPRCDAALENTVLNQVHMLQHQVGMASRVEVARFEALIDENAVLARELAAAQARSTRQAQDFARRTEALEANLLRQRAQTLARDTELQQAREALAELTRAAPDLPSRQALDAACRHLRDQVQALQRELALVREDLARQRGRADALQARLDTQPDPAPAAAPSPAPVHLLLNRAVLCVGDRPASVPLYRRVVERTGGRFLHHDGGEEHSTASLDATLGGADLVICQTGCISHDAYWRVKDHCKRTGKRCVFVDTPSRAALERALAEAGG